LAGTRFAPLGSPHRDGAEQMLKRFGPDSAHLTKNFYGILRALRVQK
jgi:hypothetical protein